MKYLLNLLSKNKDYLTILVLSFLISFPYIIDICSGYLNYNNFDLQEFLLWNYTSLNALIPYRDIFYPYGLLNYFKYYNLFFTFIYYLIVPLLFTSIYFVFKKVIKDKLSLYFSFLLFYVFTLVVVGFQAFSRYGLLMMIPLLFSYTFYSNLKIKKFTLITFGIVLGLFSTLINDQSFYLVLYFIFLFIFSKSLRIKKINFLFSDFFIQIAKEFIFVVLGFCIGVIPVFLVLQHFGSFYSFFKYFTNVKDIVVVAKTPFFSFIDSPANIFSIAILCFAIFYNFFKLFLYKQKLTLSSLLQMSLIFIILIMEQKSIIRSIDRQIVIVSLTLLMLMVSELVNVLKNKNRDKKIIYILFMAVVSIIYGFIVERPAIDFSYLPKNYSFLMNNKCFDNNLKIFLISNPSYTKIIDLLRRQQGFNGKIFSFPTGDSAFYVLLNQKPPYYNSIFEGSSYDNQISAIKYIEENKIEHVTLNTDKSSLQDGVPDYIRQSVLFKYILDNYSPFAVVENHIILKKERASDFFASEILKQVKDYEKYLLDVNLYKIPYSEGLYKYSYLKNSNKLIIESGDVNAINFFLERDTFYSTNKVLVLIPSINYKSSGLSFVKFQVENGDSTIIHYNTCIKNSACIINLSRIPLLYKERVVGKIILDREFNGKIEIFDLKDQNNLW